MRSATPKSRHTLMRPPAEGNHHAVGSGASRPRDSRTRQIVTVAALATQGNAAPQLRTHIGGALRCGVTRQELVEIMMQLVPYVGVAAAINGVAACREVFATADKK